MLPEVINSYRFIPNSSSKTSLWGSPNEQTLAIVNSSGTTVSLTFTPETTNVLREIISKLNEAYKTLVSTKAEDLKYDFEGLDILD